MPAYDGNGRLIPDFVPGDARLDNWLPTRGASIDIATTSLYAHDRWAAEPQSDASTPASATSASAARRRGDIVGADTDTLVPRLAATYDVTGDGRCRAAGDLRATTPASTARRSSRATPTSPTRPHHRLRLHRPGRAGARLRAWLRSGELHAHPRRQLPDRERLLRAGPALAGDARVHGLARAASCRRAPTRKLTYVSRDVQAASSRTSSPSTTARPRSSATASTSAPSTTASTATPTSRSGEYQALLMQGSYRAARRPAVVRALDGAAAGRRRLRRRGGQPAGRVRRSSATTRRCSRRRATIRSAASTTSSATRSACGRSGPARLGRFGALDVSRDVDATTPALTYTLFAANYPLTDIQAAPAPATPTSRRRRAEPVSSASAARRIVRGLRRWSISASNYSIPVWSTLRPYLKLEAPERAEQPEADRLGHGRHAPTRTGRRTRSGLPLNYIKGARFGQATRNLDYPTSRVRASTAAGRS